MKKLSKFILVLALFSICVSCLAACAEPNPCEKGHKYNEQGVCTVCKKQICQVKGQHEYVNGVLTYSC